MKEVSSFRVQWREATSLDLTEAQREAAQLEALQRYLDRLDRKQWRDPDTGRIISRRQRQVQVAATRWRR